MQQAQETIENPTPTNIEQWEEVCQIKVIKVESKPQVKVVARAVVRVAVANKVIKADKAASKAAAKRAVVREIVSTN